MNILISGIRGKMGTVLKLELEKENSHIILENFDVEKGIPDVILDFSHPSKLKELLGRALKYRIPVVIATTGYSNEELHFIQEASNNIPIFYSANMSTGVWMMNTFIKEILSYLPIEYDIEIVEKHHSKKKDAPSGTAQLLLETILNHKKEYQAKIGRTEENQIRNQKEITVHSVRGGTIVGEHTVLLLGEHERLEITHSAESKEIFAIGAIKAMKFIVLQKPGLYSMIDLMKGDIK